MQITRTAEEAVLFIDIRDVVLEMIVKDAVSELADFVRCYEPVFLYLDVYKRQI